MSENTVDAKTETSEILRAVFRSGSIQQDLETFVVRCVEWPITVEEPLPNGYGEWHIPSEEALLEDSP